MDIIFITLPRYLIPLARLLKGMGFSVYYLKLASKQNPAEITLLEEKLQKCKIIPLPFADLPQFTGISEYDLDPDKKAQQRAKELAPDHLLLAFEGIFPNIKELKRKLHIVVLSSVANQMMEVTGKIIIWANTHPDRKYLIIDVSYLALIAPKMPSNIYLTVLPFDILSKGIDKMSSGIFRLWEILKRHPSDQNNLENTYINPLKKNRPSRVALVLHHGLSYGNLFSKDLYLSDAPDSELHPNNLLFFDYSGMKWPSEPLAWVDLSPERLSVIVKISYALAAIRRGIIHIRKWREILGLFILVRFYVDFRSSVQKIDQFPDLRLALIDYEIVCPKELLIAFESRNIKTIATQERFIATFNNLFATTILDYYLCASPYAAVVMTKSPTYCIDSYMPVGLYRSDKLLQAQTHPLPELFKKPRKQGLKIVTALNAFTSIDWQTSQTDPLNNWTAHRNFLENMIRLSRDIPDVFIVVRYKLDNWLSLPVFSDLVKEIEMSDNIVISKDYDKYLVSYDLCAHSDLVIAMHTSLADECLSVGIPVLFHDFTHNTSRVIADEFDYASTQVLCFNYQELVERSRNILGGSSHAMVEDFRYLRENVFGNLGDGMVRKRVHSFIEKLLLEL